MNEDAAKVAMAESVNTNGSLRRRSPRLSSPQTNAKADNNMAQDPAAVKRRITVRKIAPRKTTAASEHDKENTPGKITATKRSEGSQGANRKLSTPEPTERRQRSSPKRKAALLSPTPASPSTQPPPPTPPRPQEPATDPDDAVWSQKVRRSYSRLSDQSLNSSRSRDTMFGFEQLSTPEVAPRAERSKSNLEASLSCSLSGLTSFNSLLEAEEGTTLHPDRDPNIPGVVVVQERRRRRRKAQQMDRTEVDALAAIMNAEFEEAEGFELVVE